MSGNDAQAVIDHIAEAAIAIGWQAGVGAMEIAGSIISYLAEHPERTADFMSGKTSVLDWPIGWHEHGCLTWQAMNGRVVMPEQARHARIIKSLRTKPTPDV